jgi:hypothetical protein
MQFHGSTSTENYSIIQQKNTKTSPDYYGLYDYSVITDDLIAIIAVVLLLLLFLLLLLLLLNSQQ